MSRPSPGPSSLVPIQGPQDSASPPNTSTGADTEVGGIPDGGRRPNDQTWKSRGTSLNVDTGGEQSHTLECTLRGDGAYSYTRTATTRQGTNQKPDDDAIHPRGAIQAPGGLQLAGPERQSSNRSNRTRSVSPNQRTSPIELDRHNPAKSERASDPMRPGDTRRERAPDQRYDHRNRSHRSGRSNAPGARGDTDESPRRHGEVPRDFIGSDHDLPSNGRPKPWTPARSRSPARHTTGQQRHAYSPGTTTTRNDVRSSAN